MAVKNNNGECNSLYRSTTPTIKLRIQNEDFDMTKIDICHVTIQQANGKNQKIFEHPDIDEYNKVVSVDLSQQDTLDYEYGNINIQMKIKLKNGKVITHPILTTTMQRILEEAVL